MECILTAFTQKEAQSPKWPSLSLSKELISCPLYLMVPMEREAAFGTARLQTHLVCQPL